MGQCSFRILPVTDASTFAGKTFVLRIDRTPLTEETTLGEDLTFLLERNIRPIVVASSAEVARDYVRRLNRHSNRAVGLSGADAALLPAAGFVQTGILATLTAAGYIPVIEPTGLGIGGGDVALAGDDVARAGGEAAQIVDGRIAHATIVEFLTARHLGTQVSGSVFMGTAR